MDDETTDPFPNFNGETIQGWEWRSKTKWGNDIHSTLQTGDVMFQ